MSHQKIAAASLAATVALTLAACGSDDDDVADNAATSTATSTMPTPSPAPAPEPAPEEQPEDSGELPPPPPPEEQAQPEDAPPVLQGAEHDQDRFQGALARAHGYANDTKMSRAAVQRQLASEGFSPEEVGFALDHVSANWNNNALAQAQKMQGALAPAPEVLKELLTDPDGAAFTPDEAQFAIDHL